MYAYSLKIGTFMLCRESKEILDQQEHLVHRDPKGRRETRERMDHMVFLGPL